MVKFQRIREMLVETVTGAHPVVHVNAAGTVVGNTVDTELAAAVAAADNLANPTAPQVLAHMVGTVSGGTTAARARLNGNFIQGAAILSGNGVTDASAAEFGSEQGAGAGIASLGVANMVYNGATWDMQRANTDNTALVSASRTTTAQGTSADLVNHSARGVKVTLDVTVVGTGSITLAIQAKDALSGKYTTLLTGAAVVTAVTNVYTLYPGATVAANVSASDVLPRNFRILVTHNNANAITYSVGYALVV